MRVNRIRFGSFVAAGALSGIGAIIAVAALGGYNPTTSDSYLLPTFAAVFLGTAIIEPGRFNPIGTFIGIYFLETGILGTPVAGPAGVGVAGLLRRRTRGGGDHLHAPAPPNYVARAAPAGGGQDWAANSAGGKRHEIVAGAALISWVSVTVISETRRK